MSTKLATVLALLGMTQGVESPVKDAAFPLYPGSLTVPISYLTSKELSYESANANTDLKHLGGYQCIRYGLVYTPSQQVTAETVATGLSTFYRVENTDAVLGTLVAKNFDCCTANIATAADCPSLTKTDGSSIVGNKLIIHYGGGALSNPTTPPVK